jgi:HAD superfamily hydrolase (TIGR01484 family)
VRRASRLLASDLDGTLIAPEPTPDDERGVAEFCDAVSGAGLPLAYVTGRHFTLALDGIRTARLRPPDLLACDVGTSLFARDGADFRPDEAFRAEMRASMAGQQMADVHEALVELGVLVLQPPDRQAEFKLSYYIPGDEPPDAADRVRRRLRALGAPLDVVASRDPVTGHGLLDVLPARAGKHFTLQYLERRYQLGAGRLVFAGDSGNDRAALLSGWLAILVGNAPGDLVDDLRRESERLSLADRLYFAKASGVRGVLEGCRHFEFL